ncbi:MAG TPA: DNA ligase D [Clostridia bacterium]
MKLQEYQQKRDFAKTSEPAGETAEKPRKDNLLFVVQHHIARRDHFDFRLEWNGVLLSWAVPKGPSYNPKDKRLAIQVEDHPIDYKDFEGVIPKGQYGGGTVMLWDEGYWKPLNDVDKGLSEGSLKFELFGSRLKGKWALVRLKDQDNKDEKNWILLKEKDEYASSGDKISNYFTSIRTGRTMSQIEKGIQKSSKNPISQVSVQLAKLADRPPESEDWLFEIKYDGYRIVAFVEDGSARLISRGGKDFTKHFEPIAQSLEKWAAGRAMVLDGEVVIIDSQGRTDFQALQNYMKDPKGKSLTYIIFDLLALDGADLRDYPLIQRKEMLSDLMKDAPKNLYFSRHVLGNGKQNLEAACRLNMEGIVGKKINSKYTGTRNGDWVKIKCSNSQEFVIGGYTKTDKKIKGISSILLGYYDGDNLIYCGRAGTGFTEKTQQELEQKFESVKQPGPPFSNAPKPKTNENITWLKPIYVAQVNFAEWTKDNLLRQASFKGLRMDKDPKEVVKETPKSVKENDNEDNKENKKAAQNLDLKPVKKGVNVIIGGIKITNPDKIAYPDLDLKKIDVVNYYAQVSSRMLPYVKDRILSVIRCPKGVEGSCFFKKHRESADKGIAVIPVINSEGESQDYFYIQDEYGLISEAQMGTVEFHVWGSSVPDIDKPDLMVFDLDPDEELGLEQVRQGVKDLKNLLDQLNLVSFLKTSGGKGYHVVVPFKPSVDWDTFGDFAKRVANALKTKWPEKYTDNIRKANRKGRIYIDWVRNGKGATSVAPYSLRARAGAKVSMPLAWDELDSMAPDGINIFEALSRLNNPDPWEGFFEVKQELKS